MSEKKRIIPCLDVTGGRVVKGVNFVDLNDIGNPVEIAQAYVAAGADELVFLDISATVDQRKTMVDLVAETAKHVAIPLTVGGGIATVEDIRALFAAGVDKVSIGSAALKNPAFIQEAAENFGKEKIVIAIDAKYQPETKTWHVYSHGGQVDTNIDVIDWAKEVEKRGAGEILLTSMDGDGVKTGYDIDLTKAVAEAVQVPVIASGGCGSIDDIIAVFKETNVSGALAASVFHYGELEIPEIKERLKAEGIAVQ